MAYVPHTDAERRAMLARIGVGSVEDLFDDVPTGYRFPGLNLPEPLSELEVLAELREMSEANADLQHNACFLGAGAYHHFVPSVVGHVIGRSEFYTAYTPYQPEISQGTLQSIFEYQTMICELTGMDVSNASHYDGATALAEAIILALSATRGKRSKVVVSPGIHPEYLATARTYVEGMDVRLVGDDVAGRNPGSGQPSIGQRAGVDPAALAEMVDEDTACLVVQNPDFFGRIVDLTGVAEAVHARGALLAVACNPISLGLLKPPGAFDADVALGEGQPLGIPLSFGGPHLGFFACKEKYVRRMAGRLVGETEDIDGTRGYVLTLSTREQHIRRERATSNICTNQGLNTLAAAAYLAAMGRCGLAQVARLCYHRAHYAAEAISVLDGYAVDLSAPFFSEFVVRCPHPVAEMNEVLLEDYGIVGGYDLSRAYPELENQMLLCVTEMNSADEIDALVQALEELSS